MRRTPRRVGRTGTTLAILLGMTVAAHADEAVTDQIRRAVKTALQAQWPEQELRIDLVEPDARLNLSPCEQPLEAASLHPGPLRAAVTMMVSCRGARPWRVYVPARVSAMGEVVVARRPLAAGAMLTPQDVARERRALTDLSQGYLRQLDTAIGSTLRQPVAEGAVILPGQVVQPRAVRRGQRVVIEAVRGAMQVNGSGEALADGMPGERIKVRNVGSGRVVEATVRPDGRVRVEF